MATHSRLFLPGESQGWGSLVGCHLWGRTESDMTEATQQQLSATIPCNYATILYPNQSLLNKHAYFFPAPTTILDQKM